MYTSEEIELLFGEFERAGYTEEKERAMTFAEKMEQRGIQKGIKEGIQKGKVAGRVEGEHITLIRQLDKKFGITEEEAELIRQNEDLSKIEAALDEILDAASKAQVLDHLK